MPDPDGDMSRYSQQDSLGNPRVGETPRLQDDPEKLEALADRLDEVGDYEAEPGDRNEDVEEPDGEPESEPESDTDSDDKDDSEADSEDDELEPQEAVDGEEETPESTPPSAWRRSLKSRGWDDDEIDTFWQADPERASKVFERTHNSRNAELAEWAKLGRERQQHGSVTPRTDTAASPTQTAPSAVETQLERLNPEKLAETSGLEQSVAEAIAAPLNQMIDQLNTAFPMVRRSVRAAEENERAALRQLVENFLNRDDVKPFADFYGSLDDASGEQLSRQNELLQTADALVAGADCQERKVTAMDALLDAHSMLTADQRESQARTDLKKKVRQRGKGLSLKPSRRKARRTGGKPTRTQMERRVGEALRSIFPS